MIDILSKAGDAGCFSSKLILAHLLFSLEEESKAATKAKFLLSEMPRSDCAIAMKILTQLTCDKKQKESESWIYNWLELKGMIASTDILAPTMLAMEVLACKTITQNQMLVSKSIKLLEQPCTAGYPPALFLKGRWILENVKETTNNQCTSSALNSHNTKEEALKLLRESALRGFQAAQLLLAKVLLEKSHQEFSFLEGIAWLESANKSLKSKNIEDFLTVLQTQIEPERKSILAQTRNKLLIQKSEANMKNRKLENDLKKGIFACT